MSPINPNDFNLQKSDGKATRVLVVDDTVATRYALCRQLQRAGFETFEAGTGLDALKEAAALIPDIITLDIHLPDILGFEVARRLKQNEATGHIPILHLSASFVTSRDKIEGLEGGADGYLTHPVDPAVLISTIRALIRLNRTGMALQQSEKNFRTLSDANSQKTISAGIDGLIDFENRSAIENFGAWIGRGLKEFFDACADQTDRWALRDRWTKAQAMGSTSGEAKLPVKAEVRLFAPGEKTGRWHLVEMLSIWSDKNEMERLIITCTDVHDLKNLQEEVVLAKEAAERASQAKSQFLANMSHEIRTPLGIILGFSEIAAEGVDATSEQHSALHTVRRNALHLAALVDEILDLSKIEADRLELTLVPVSLEQVLDSAVQTFVDKCALKHLSFSFEVLTDLPSFLISDQVRLSQILFNLIGNAVKFTAQGIVTLRVGMSSGAPGTGAEKIEIDIVDTGIGITSEQEKQLFQVFSQGDPTITRRFGGSGLGLALSRKLAEALGGELNLIPSEIGQGSHFRLTLPVNSSGGSHAWIPKDLWASKPGFEIKLDARAAALRHSSVVAEPLATGGVGAEVAKKSSTDSGPNFSSKRLLVVEDSSDNQFLIQRFLKSTGIQVTIAENGFKGVEAAVSSQFDMVLMDIQMPDMDGVTATKKIRAAGCQMPIVALTAHALKGDREQCLEAGCSDYLTKPIHKDLLIQMLTKYLN